MIMTYRALRTTLLTVALALPMAGVPSLVYGAASNLAMTNQVASPGMPAPKLTKTTTSGSLTIADASPGMPAPKLTKTTTSGSLTIAVASPGMPAPKLTKTTKG
jgi:hypothetical protein